MTRNGFTTIEMILVVVIIGIIATIGFPRVRDSLEKESRRSMRAALANYIVLARSSAVARGCRSSVHFVSGGNSRLWVTSCNVEDPLKRDTVAGPIWTEAEWNHRFQALKDSVTFNARGLRLSLEPTRIVIKTKGDVPKDSVVVNGVGKVIYP